MDNKLPNITIKLPKILYVEHGCEPIVRVPARTVGDSLERLFERFPAMRSQLIAMDGTVKRFVNIYLDEEDIRFLQNLQTPLEPDAVVTIIPAIAT
jgi:sulfur-carrier protein